MSDNLTPQAAILTAAFSPGPATPSQAPSARPAPTAPAPSVPVNPTAPITASQASTMADWARQDAASGKLSPEAATKLFNELGVPLDQRGTPADLRTAEQILVDLHFPIARQEEIRIPYADPGQAAPQMTPELKQFDESARTWLVGAEFPATLANSLVTTISKVAQQTKHLNADALESYGLLQYERLEKIYGDKLEEKLNAAGKMVQELEKKTPGLNNLLKSKGLGDNAEVASLLIQQAERYWIRRKGR